MESDRRTTVRYTPGENEVALRRTNVIADLLSGRSNLAVELLDLGATGARVAVRTELPMGCRVHISIRLTKFNEKLDFRGTVQWVRKGEVGIRFHRIDSRQAVILRNVKGWFTSEAFQARRSTGSPFFHLKSQA